MSEELWCRVKLYDQETVEGRLSGQTIGGLSFLKVEMVDEDGKPSKTRLYGPGALHSMEVISPPAGTHNVELREGNDELANDAERGDSDEPPPAPPAPPTEQPKVPLF
jgi:hypothetical protein